jgi:MYXO-CTERM domain-containing protein
MRRKHVGLAALTSALAASTGAAAADLHVGSGQSYASVQDAANAAQPGDSILVHVGNYSGDVDLTGSGTQNARITLTTANDGVATIEGRVTIDGSYWDIRDLSFVPPSGSRGFRVRGDDNRLINIELSGGDRDGVNASGSRNEVRDSRIHNFDAGQADAHCIVLNPGATDWVISGNELYDCSGDTIQLFAASATREIKGTVIDGNHMYFTGGLSRTENAIDVKDADGLIITNNLMHGFPDNKIVVFQKAPANITMQCNVMYDGLTGVEFRGEDGGTVENVTFARNVMSNYSSYALKFDGTAGANVYNNTFVDIGSDGLRIEGAGLDGGTVHNNLWANTGAIDAGNFTADYNGFFQTGSNGIAAANDVNADPLLDGQYQLMVGSPMIDSGLAVGLMFAGTAPDIGFHEVGLDACEPAQGTGGGTGTGGGGAGATSSSGAGGGTSSAGAGGNTPGSGASPQEDGGCGCRVPSRGNGHTDWLALLSALGLSTLARRRRCARSKP